MHTATMWEFEEPKPDKEPKEIASEPTPLPSLAHVKQPLIWRNIIGIAVLHILAVYLLATNWSIATMWTWIFSPIYGFSAGLGITAGAHRLWAHRSYSAKLPLRIFLACLYCAAGQVLRSYHDMVGLHYAGSNTCVRLKTRSAENPIVSVFTLGEGWHNYHHVFPWDYKASELGAYSLNGSCAFIETMAKWGLAYNLRTPRRETIEKQYLMKGDGTASPLLSGKIWG